MSATHLLCLTFTFTVLNNCVTIQPVAVSVALAVGVSIGLNFIIFKMFKKMKCDYLSIIRSSYHGRIFVINLAIAIVDSVETNRWLLHRRVLHKLHPGGQEQLRPSDDREENLRSAWM